jgi:hypothetical protein
VLGVSAVDPPFGEGVVETAEVTSVRLPVVYGDVSTVLPGVESVDIEVVFAPVGEAVCIIVCLLGEDERADLMTSVKGPV